MTRLRSSGAGQRALGVFMLLLALPLGVIVALAASTIHVASPGLVAAAVMVLVGTPGARMAMTGRRQKAARKAAMGHPSVDARPPVLYLRSFEDDPAMASGPLLYSYVTQEENWAWALSRIGPFVALGNPREPLPQVGASRSYTGDAEWMQRVEALMSEAALVVVLLRSTPSLLWEIRTAARLVEPHRLLLLVPYDPRDWPSVKAVYDKMLPKPLPLLNVRWGMRHGAVRGIVAFENDWSPRFLRIRFSLLVASARRSIAPQLLLTLRPVFANLGIPWSRPRPGIAITALIAYFAAMAVIILWERIG